jgi:predicted  nucleic acid-binding Zn-ribbon protein
MYVRNKVSKELKEPELKEKIRKDFELTQDELQKKDDKYKRAKITVDEVEMRMKLDEDYIKIIKDK